MRFRHVGSAQRRLLVSLAVVAGLGLATADAEAQYKNAQLGFEGGYGFYANDLAVANHGFLIGLRGAFKAEDHWWFSARGLLSFRSERAAANPKTVVILHLVPVAVRYYIKTDSFRPFVGITNSFNFLLNTTDGTRVLWGPGVSAGVEIKLARDIFLAFQADGFYMFAFQAPDDPMFTLTAQLNFFL